MSKFILIFGLFLISLNLFSENIGKIGDNAVKSFAKIMKKENDWFLAGYGGSYCDPDNILLSITFEINDQLSLAQVRKLFIETSEKFINFINRNKKYCHIFKESSIKKNNFEISLIFCDQSGKYLDNEYVTGLLFMNDKIYYYYANKERTKLDRSREIKETYEEAYAIVMNTKHMKEQNQLSNN